MKLVSYIKDKVISIVIYLLMVVLISLILKVFNLDKFCNSVRSKTLFPCNKS